MEYWLIAFLVIVVLSPLAWLKSSPGQQRVTRFRSRAMKNGLQVQLVPEVDAEESAKRPEAVRYFLGFPDQSGGDLGTWTLIRHHRRGRESPWDGWKWFRDEAPPHCHERIGRALGRFPDAVYGLRADRGVAAYLTESGDESVVDQVAEGLKILVGE